jgi:Transposase IS66 family
MPHPRQERCAIGWNWPHRDCLGPVSKSSGISWPVGSFTRTKRGFTKARKCIGSMGVRRAISRLCDFHQKRGREAMDEIGILPNYHGRIMRDRWSSYDNSGCLHSVCGAHLLRDLTGVYERSKQQWAAQMKRVLIAMNKVAWYWRNLGAKAVPKSIRDRWVARYFDVLSTGFAAQPPPPQWPMVSKNGGAVHKVKPRICWMRCCIELIKCWPFWTIFLSPSPTM